MIFTVPSNSSHPMLSVSSNSSRSSDSHSSSFLESFSIPELKLTLNQAAASISECAALRWLFNNAELPWHYLLLQLLCWQHLSAQETSAIKLINADVLRLFLPLHRNSPWQSDKYNTAACEAGQPKREAQTQEALPQATSTDSSHWRTTPPPSCPHLFQSFFPSREY